MSKPLVNLHLHSSFSLLDGAAHIKSYIKKAKEFGHPAITLTDHGSMQGVYSLYKEAKEAGVKPIIGSEFYITTDTSIRLPNRHRDVLDRDKHIIILAKNDIGYKNMCKLNYLSYFEGFYFKPRISFQQLFENKEGLIITTACAGGHVSQLFTSGRLEDAEYWFKRFKEEFKEDFYAEIQLNEITAKVNKASADGLDMDQKKINDFMISLSKKYNVKLVLGGDSHYAEKEDVRMQDIMLNCQRRKDGPEVTVDQQSFFHARHLFYQSSDDLYEFNKDFGYDYEEDFLDKCFENSIEVADKCNFDFEIGVDNYPRYELPKGVTDKKEYITQLAFKVYTIN